MFDIKRKIKLYCPPVTVRGTKNTISFTQEATDGVRRKVFLGMSGTFQDCWAARQEIANGEFAAICDIITMKKAMAWDYRLGPANSP